jgi:hypothetical protein
MAYVTFVMAAVTALATTYIAQPTNLEQVLPSRQWGDLFIVDAVINGKGPFALVVDTGAAKTMLDPRVAEQLGKIDQNGDSLTTPNEMKIKVGSAIHLDSIKVGSVELPGSDVPLMDFTPFRYAMREDIDGLLGFDAFKELILTLDYPRGQVRTRVGALALEEGAVPFYLGSLQVPQVSVEIGDHRTSVLVDSGSMSGLMLAEYANPTLKSDWREVGASVRADGWHNEVAARLDGSFVIASFAFIDPIVGRLRGDQALVGVQIMRHMAWAFDQKNELILVMGDETRIGPSPAKRGTGMAGRSLSDGEEVVAVFPGSPAERAGIKQGDLIVQVNQQPVAKIGCGVKNRWIQNDASLQLTVRRGEELIDKVVGIEVIVP